MVIEALPLALSNKSGGNMEEKIVKFPHWAQKISVTLKRVTTYIDKLEFYLNGQLITLSANELSATFSFQPNSHLRVMAKPQGQKPWRLECAFYVNGQLLTADERKLGGGHTYDQSFLLIQK